jgi:hypothetical protein
MDTLYERSRPNSWTTNPTEAKAPKKKKNKKIKIKKNKKSSGGSLVATPDCETAVLGSNPAISSAYSGLPILRWAAIWDGTSL